MIVDTSAILAIILQEPGHERLEEHLAGAPTPKIGAPTELEAAIVLTARLGARGRTVLARLLQHGRVVTVPFTPEHTEIAAEAFNRFGKGRHPAALNFCDCCTYATAFLAGEPLLCVGNDFARTDLTLIE